MTAQMFSDLGDTPVSHSLTRSPSLGKPSLS